MGFAVETITSRQNDSVKRVAALCDDPSLRAAQNRCVAHGYKLCAEALRLGSPIETLWLTERFLQEQPGRAQPLADAAGNVVLMSDSVRDKLSPQRSPQDLLAVMEIPARCATTEIKRHERLVLLCDIQDPANVGAILRSAAALGYGGAVLAGACADAFSPKALRAGMGAQFGIELATAQDAAEAVQALKRGGHQVVATALTADAADIRTVASAPQTTIVVGNEGTGLPAAVVAACDIAAVIPISDKAESLNAAAAAAIAMWELRHGR